MCVSKVQEVTAIDNIGPRSEDREIREAQIDLGHRLYHAACASFKRNHGYASMPSLAELTWGQISTDRNSDEYMTLGKKTCFSKLNTGVSGRSMIELDGDTVVAIGWRKLNELGGIVDLVVKVTNPDQECIEFLAEEGTLHRYNVTAIGERYEVGRPDHPYRQET